MLVSITQTERSVEHMRLSGALAQNPNHVRRCDTASYDEREANGVRAATPVPQDRNRASADRPRDSAHADVQPPGLETRSMSQNELNFRPAWRRLVRKRLGSGSLETRTACTSSSSVPFINAVSGDVVDEHASLL